MDSGCSCSSVGPRRHGVSPEDRHSESVRDCNAFSICLKISRAASSRAEARSWGSTTTPRLSDQPGQSSTAVRRRANDVRCPLRSIASMLPSPHSRRGSPAVAEYGARFLCTV